MFIGQESINMSFGVPHRCPDASLAVFKSIVSAVFIRQKHLTCLLDSVLSINLAHLEDRLICMLTGGVLKWVGLCNKRSEMKI